MRTRTLLVAGVFLLGAACSRTLDTQGLEDQIADLLAERGGPTVTEISCPEDVTVEEGGTFECTATGEGATWTIEVTQTDDEGHVDMQIVNASEGA